MIHSIRRAPPARAFLLCALFVPALLCAQTRVREPLPLEVVTSLQGHNGRSPIGFSADGEWIAHTVQTSQNVPRDPNSSSYSPTGFPFGEGDARMEATVTHTRTGESISMGEPGSTSWAPVWSPDGKRVAFYSDAGGEAGLWIWDRVTRKATRFPGVIVRPFFGFEGARWSADSRRVMAKILPAGVSIAQANAKQVRGSMFEVTTVPPPAAPGQPSVLVRRHDPASAVAAPAPAVASEVRNPPTHAEFAPSVDLALMDLDTGEVTRLVQGAGVQWYAFAPDRKSVAYTVLKGFEPNTQQGNFDLFVRGLPDGAARLLAPNVRLGYGIECNWSPDSRTIACIESGQMAKGEVVLFPAAGGAERRLQGAGLPGFDANRQGEHAPLWSADSSQVFAVGNGELWRVDARTARGAAVAKIPGWQVSAPISGFGQPVLWTGNKGRTAWVVARENGGASSGIYAVDLPAAQSKPLLREPRAYAGLFNVAASAAGDLAFVSTGQQALQDIWFLDTRSGRARQGTRLNTALDRYELGTARVIEWKGPEGQALRGMLLLPPGFQPGKPAPMVVDVYGGAMGSNYVNRFGGPLGSAPMLNMHVLATRGYVVMFPDAPLRTGQTMTDIAKVVMPGVDAAIAQGYADPERLAVIGQSYGSYNTLSLIVQTDRFKAASITAAVLHPDLLAAYLSGGTGYYEQGQGNMGGTPWDQRQRYIDNSPVWLFDRIETPLLIGQGERDGDLKPANAIYTALERLNKPVELRVYGAESHVISQKPNVIDFWRRRLEFFAEHLDFPAGRAGLSSKE